MRPNTYLGHEYNQSVLKSYHTSHTSPKIALEHRYAFVMSLQSFPFRIESKSTYAMLKGLWVVLFVHGLFEIQCMLAHLMANYIQHCWIGKHVT